MKEKEVECEKYPRKMTRCGGEKSMLYNPRNFHQKSTRKYDVEMQKPTNSMNSNKTDIKLKKITKIQTINNNTNNNLNCYLLTK